MRRTRPGRIKGRFRHTPLWITEFSWDSKPPDPGGLPMQILKRWTAEALYRAWSAGISHFFWFGLRDQAPNPKLPFSETYRVWSLLPRRNGCRRHGRSRTCTRSASPSSPTRATSGFFFWGRTPNSKRGKVVIQIRKGGGWRNAAVDACRPERDLRRRGRRQLRAPQARDGAGRYRGESAVPFSLKPDPRPNCYQAPFGNPKGSRNRCSQIKRHKHKRK